MSAILTAAGTAARAADEPNAVAVARDEAKRLFDEGTELYDAREFVTAIARFRQAYRLWPDPLLIFAVAQAQRLDGACKAAADSYARFLKVAAPSPARDEAATHAMELARTCPALATLRDAGDVLVAAPLAPHAAPIMSPPLSTLVERPSRAPTPRTSRRVVLALSAAGAVLGGVGVGTYVWNTSRLDHWRTEDAWLGSGAAAMASFGEVSQRQQANDDLSRSIHRYDQIALGFAVAGGIAILGAAALYVIDGARARERGRP